MSTKYNVKNNHLTINLSKTHNFHLKKTNLKMLNLDFTDPI